MRPELERRGLPVPVEVLDLGLPLKGPDGKLLGVLTLSAVMVIVANVLTDLSYRWIDPRLRGR